MQVITTKSAFVIKYKDFGATPKIKLAPVHKLLMCADGTYMVATFHKNVARNLKVYACRNLASADYNRR